MSMTESEEAAYSQGSRLAWRTMIQYCERHLGGVSKEREQDAGATTLFQCPRCNGPHFNATLNGTLYCASVSKFTDFKPKQGGCGWYGVAE